MFSDAHVGSDLAGGRESLATAIRQSEGPAGFEWDIALDLGDMSGAQGLPKDEEGKEIVRQFRVLARHRREQIYDLSGNHDRSGLGEPQAWWWRKWVDPTGEHTKLLRSRCEEAAVSDRRNLGALLVSGRQYSFPDDERHQRAIAEDRARYAWRKSRRCGQRRDVPLVEAKRRTESLVDHRHRPSLRSQGHDRCIGRVGRHATRRQWRLDFVVSRLLSRGYASGCFVPLLGGQQAGLQGL